jgi:hypothetical protein
MLFALCVLNDLPGRMVFWAHDSFNRSIPTFTIAFYTTMWYKTVKIRKGGEIMLVEGLKDQWVCSCGNWVDRAFDWCPDCCEEKSGFRYDARRFEKPNVKLSS